MGLSGLVLVLYVAQKQLFRPLAGAAGSTMILLAASFFPNLLGPAYVTSRGKGGVDPMTIRAIPIGGSHESSASLDADWVDATKASLQLGPVNVQVVGVLIRRADAVKSSSNKQIAPGDYCFVRIRTQEQVAAGQFSAKRSQTHESHIEDASLKLTDSAAKSHELQGVLKAEVMDKQLKGPAFPVSFQDHVFIFEAPASRPNSLRLEIDAKAWGGKAALRFAIPGSMITDERGKPGRS
jgi:hypothetical protein